MRSLPLILSLLFAASAAPAAELQPFALDYQASYDSLGATASRSLTAPGADGLWQLQSKVEVKLLGATITSIEEQSRFGWQNDLPQSSQYRYVQKGAGHRERGISFDSSGQHAQWSINDNKGELALTPPTFDSLDSMLVLRHQLQAGNKDISFQVADKSELTTQRYQVVGNETLTTLAGSFATVHVRRMRDGDSKRTTDLWLAPELDHAMVKLVQVEPDGSTITLTLKQGKVGATTLPAR